MIDWVDVGCTFMHEHATDSILSSSGLLELLGRAAVVVVAIPLVSTESMIWFTLAAKATFRGTNGAAVVTARAGAGEGVVIAVGNTKDDVTVNVDCTVKVSIIVLRDEDVKVLLIGQFTLT